MEDRATRERQARIEDEARTIAERLAGPRRLGSFATVFVTVGGIFLPAFVLLIELASRMCRGEFFDPLPSLGHVLLVALVPAALLHALVRHGDRPGKPWTLTFALGGAALGVSFVYTLIFLPLLPIAIFAVMFAGMGLMPLAPVFSLLAGWLLLAREARIGAFVGAPRHALWLGMAGSVLALTLLEVRPIATLLALRWTLSGNVDQQARGLYWLRAIGDEDEVLRICLPFAPGRPGLFAIGRLVLGPFDVEDGRRAFYRMTGRTFDAQPIPRHLRREQNVFEPAWGWERGSATPELSLAGSRIDASVDATAAVGYLEWTLELESRARGPREARAELLLPEGGVVSRVTLWVDGEEREAAFAARARVTEAYERVTRRQLDPILVTTSGAGRVQMRGSPVPPTPGRFRFRIGVTFPLQLDGDGAQASFALPCLAEANFALRDVSSSTWIASRDELLAPNADWTAARGADGASGLRGERRDPSEPLAFVVRRDAASRSAWARSTLDPEVVVQQAFVAREVPPRGRTVLVVDASSACAAHWDELCDGLEQAALPGGLDLLLAGDTVEALEDVGSSEAAAWLRARRGVGGIDAAPALVAAFDRAEVRGTDVVWIHGPQPLQLGSLEALRQRVERGAVEITAAGLVAGRNLVLEALDDVGVARGRALDAAQVRLGVQRLLQERRTGFVELRRELARIVGERGEGGQTSDHLVRLWANGEVQRRIATQDPRDREAALELAARFQLVTPLSGAVVLETEAQYAEAGLTPVDRVTVPGIPEPETLALLAVAGLAALGSWRSRRRGARAAA